MCWCTEFQVCVRYRCCCRCVCPGNTDAMQLLGGLLSVLPERVSKTMEAHKDVLLKRVSSRHTWRAGPVSHASAWGSTSSGAATAAFESSVKDCMKPLPPW